MAADVEDDPMLSSHPGAGNHCDSVNQIDLWQNSLGTHPGLHSVKRNGYSCNTKVRANHNRVHSLKQKYCNDCVPSQ